MRSEAVNEVVEFNKKLALQRRLQHCSYHDRQTQVSGAHNCCFLLDNISHVHVKHYHANVSVFLYMKVQPNEILYICIYPWHLAIDSGFGHW